MLIHCENEPARDFYLRLAKFDPSPTDPMHLLLLVKDLRQAISGGLPAGSPRRETAAAPWLVGISGHRRRGPVPPQGVTVPQSGQ